jgi:hypothetical protein
MVKLELSVEEATVLREQLAYRLTQLDRDLVRTDQHRLQHALARDVAHLNDVQQRLAGLLGPAD